MLNYKFSKMHFQRIFFLLIITLFFQMSSAQNSDDVGIMKTILTTYYKNEKVIVKDRAQYLFLYCERANNNEEILEALNKKKLSAQFSAHVKNMLKTDTSAQSWDSVLDQIIADDKTKLTQKVNGCKTLEQYQEVSKILNLNNQRLMIVSKPLYNPDGKNAFVKVVFYRNIEHNSGAVLYMEKIDGQWKITEYLNEWAT